MTSCSRSVITTQVGAPGVLDLSHDVRQGAAPQCQAGRTTWQYGKHLLPDLLSLSSETSRPLGQSMTAAGCWVAC